jgi:DNA-binding PadR family transcriptional regulator
VISWRAKRISLLFVGFFAWAWAQASPWEFSPPRTLSGPQARVFHHLEAAGRSSIAVSEGAVTVVWEDNRDGVPRAYVALRAAGADEFVEQRLSAEAEAYEPAVTALPHGRFAFGWEEGGQVWVRSGGPAGLDPARSLARGAQLTLAAGERGLYAAWAERAGRASAIRVARLTPGKPGATLGAAGGNTVTAPPSDEQLYPALAVLKSSVLVAWEDRRHGHTVILYASTRDGQRFTPAQILNEQLPRRSQQFGRGTGAARVALARLEAERAAAVWLDKRDFEGGYDVYSAQSARGTARFGRNERVQDEFGNNIGQWHATLAAHDGLLVAAWDDDRDGGPDLWLSWRDAHGWSPNLGVPGASGAGSDTSPAIALDAAGGLHLAWIAQESADGPTQLRYLYGRRTGR